MANQPDKRQQFRFWYPFWGNASSASRPPARPSPTNQSSRTQQPSAPPPADKRFPPRTPSLSPSPSSSSSSSSRSTPSSPAKQNPPKRISSRTPSSSSQPSPTQSPSRRLPRSEQGKQKAKEESTQDARRTPPMSPETPSRSHSPSKGDDNKSPADETSNEPKATPEEKAASTDESIKTVDANNGSKDLEKTIEAKSIRYDPITNGMVTETGTRDDVENRTKADEQDGVKKKTEVPSDASTGNKDSETRSEDKATNTDESIKTVDANNGSKDLEKTIEAKSIRFNPVMNGTPTETGTRDDVENRTKADEQDLKKAQVPSDASTGDKDSEMRSEEKKSITDENHQKIDIMAAPAQHGSSKETIKEIEKPTPDVGSPKEAIKNATADDNKHSDNKLDPNARENPVTNNPKKKEKITVAGSSSDVNVNSTRTSFQKNIKDGISKLVQKINAGSERGANAGASIITLAGENKGASMHIGHENESGHEGNFERRGCRSSKGKEKIGIAREGEDDEDEKEKIAIAANVNSNVQSVNNSVMQESSCDVRDPGVHLRVSSRLRRKKVPDGDN